MKTYGEKLRLVRLAFRWQQTALAELLQIPQSHLSQMESGIRHVPDSIAAQVSFLTGFSPQFFARPVQVDVPMGSNLWYRKPKNKYRKADESQAYCQLVFDTFEALAQSLKPLNCRLSSVSNCTPQEAADHVRNSLGIRPGIPIENITIRAETAGIRVIGLGEPVIEAVTSHPALPRLSRAEGEDEFEAFSFWTSCRTPVVFARSDRPCDRYNWALGHELIHLVMHASYHGDIRLAERECQLGTAELFMPEQAFRDSFPFDGPSVSALAQMASYWNVSLKSVILRAHQLGLLSDRSKLYFLGADRKGESKRVLVRAQRPRFYRQMCELLYGTPVSAAALARKTGASKHFIHAVLVAHSGKSEDLEPLFVGPTDAPGPKDQGRSLSLTREHTEDNS
jgi:Zn-dependent peptidase ImmA (M78 family)/transcriptional regulator with XRE-family HTH domain